LAINNFLLLI